MINLVAYGKWVFSYMDLVQQHFTLRLNCFPVSVRLSESLYYVKNVGENGVRMDELNRLIGFSGAENSCLPAGMFENAKQSVMTEDPHLWFSGRESKRSVDSTLSGHSMFIDSDISAELRNKVEKYLVILCNFGSLETCFLICVSFTCSW